LNGKKDLKIDLDCTADDFDLWAYMSQEEQSQEPSSDNNTPAFRFPSDIDMRLSYEIDKIRYDNIDFDRVNGSLSLKKALLEISPTRLRSLGGDMSIEGKVQHQGPEQLHYHFDLATKNSEFNSAFQSISMLQSIAPIFKHMFGEFDTQLSLDGDLDKQLTPVLSSLSAQGVLETLNARVRNFKILDKLSAILGESVTNNLRFNKTKNWFSIENGMFFLEPTSMILGKEQWTVEGNHQIEGEMEYLFSGPISIGQLKNSSMGKEIWNSVNQSLNSIGASAIPEDAMLDVDIVLSGTASNPSVSIKPLQNLDAQIRSIVDQKKEDKKQALKEEIDKEKEKLEKLAAEKKKEVKKDVGRELKSLVDSGKTTSRVDSLKREAKKKTEEVKKKFKKWNPFGN